MFDEILKNYSFEEKIVYSPGKFKKIQCKTMNFNASYNQFFDFLTAKLSLKCKSMQFQTYMYNCFIVAVHKTTIFIT